MSSSSMEYGIFEQNVLLNEYNNQIYQQPRTAILGQIVIIDKKTPENNYVVRFLKDNAESWESKHFYCPQKNVLLVCRQLWPYLASVTSPQERLKLVKNRALCEKLKRLATDMTVGFMEANQILLGTIKYIGTVKGIGYCYGIDLHEKKNNNQNNGSVAGIHYFSCRPGHGLFTTIERIVPNTYPGSAAIQADPDDSLEAKMDSLKPDREEIVTKYGEYPKTQTSANTPKTSLRNSRSLQSILDADDSANANNDFDQNTVIQPDKTYLVKEAQKSKVRSELDLIDVIGSWQGTMEKKRTESGKDGLNGVKTKRNVDRNGNLNGDSGRNGHHYELSTVSRRNKSINPLTHLLDGGTLKKSTAKFYKIDDSLRDEPRGAKKQDAVASKSKINAKHDRLPKSTFYLTEENGPVYVDPLPGTTDDLAVGSLVEVLNDVSEEPMYGVVRWMGAEKGAEDRVLVGVELEEEQSHRPLTLTDGRHNGRRRFECAENRALFVPLGQCARDSRFQDGPPEPVNQACAVERMECAIIPGAVAPLCMPTEEDVGAVCGKYRGIQGHHNSCYLDVTLFSMFTYTAVFDSLLFRPKSDHDIDDYEEVQRVLREEIVNPLRKNLYVSADHVMRLRRLLDKLSSVSGLTSEEKDPEEFLNSLLAQILKAEPFLKLDSGQEAFHYQLFVEKDADLTLPTVQQLFEQSFLTSNVKLKEVPSCLIVQMPRFGKSYKMYPRILPSQLLDVTDIIEGSPRQCTVCGRLAEFECRQCFDGCSNAGLESTAFCPDCLGTAHRHETRKHHVQTRLAVAREFSAMRDACKPPRLYMELFAVICIETSHYVAFVKCGVGHEAPWCFFDSMADRLGEKNGFNIPEMVACPDVSQWLSDDRICRRLHEEFPHDRHLPEHARRLLCDAYICMYQSSDVMMYR